MALVAMWLNELPFRDDADDDDIASCMRKIGTETERYKSLEFFFVGCMLSCVLCVRACDGAYGATPRTVF